MDYLHNYDNLEGNPYLEGNPCFVCTTRKVFQPGNPKEKLGNLDL